MHITLILVLKRFEPKEVDWVVADSLCIHKSMVHQLENVEAYVPVISKEELWAMLLLESNEPSRAVGPAQWQDNRELLYLPDHQAKCYRNPEHIKHAKLPAKSTFDKAPTQLS